MSTISDDADALLELANKVSSGRAIAEQASKLPDDIFNELMAIVGNMHDPVVINVTGTVRYAQELIEDYDRALSDIYTAIRRKGLALKRLGQREM